MKRSPSKLSLHRETLKALDAESLREAAGGVTRNAVCASDATIPCTLCLNCQ